MCCIMGMGVTINQGSAPYYRGRIRRQIQYGWAHQIWRVPGNTLCPRDVTADKKRSSRFGDGRWSEHVIKHQHVTMCQRAKTYSVTVVYTWKTEIRNSYMGRPGNFKIILVYHKTGLGNVFIYLLTNGLFYDALNISDYVPWCGKEILWIMN